ncbi:MAG: triosephosphate isomerase [Alphaproteobacteria bacterium]|nr:triosephosphate isomerase [Rickettsiales bacterium]
MGKKKFVFVGNWKMNGTSATLGSYFNSLNKSFKELGCIFNRDKDAVVRLVQIGEANVSAEVIICPPSVYISQSVNLSTNVNVNIGGQVCCSIDKNGAFTGCISAGMLKDVGCSHVIVAHSEARNFFNYSTDDIAKIVYIALKNGIYPIVCFGESKSGSAEGVIAEVKDVFDKVNFFCLNAGLNSNLLGKIVIAYEPVWSIGSGNVPSSDYIGSILLSIKQALIQSLGSSATLVRLIYGGSVDAKNAYSILNIPDVCGLIVGGASLVPKQFVQIVSSVGINS